MTTPTLEGGVTQETKDALILPGLTGLLREAAGAAQLFVAEAKPAVKAGITGANGKIDRALADEHQHQVHGYGWYAAYAELMNQVAGWAERLEAEGRFGEIEALLAQLLFSEYCAQLVGGVPMNQGEIVRPAHLVTDRAVLNRLYSNGLMKLMVEGGTQAVKTRIAKRLAEARGRPTLEYTGLDETFEMIRDQFHAFAEEKVTPFAHEWHLKDQLIPIELVEELGALGVFGLTIPEEYGGSGMGKTAMCVVSEELSRAWIGVGSLATRSEIAGELILTGGTEEQKQYWLPKISDASILPTAVFTEPNTGSDLGSLRTRAELTGEQYVVTGEQDLDHPRRPRRRHDPAGPHRPGHDRLSRPVDAAGREAARRGGRRLPGRRHERRRDRGDRLSRHEGIRARLRRLYRAGPEPAGRRARPGLQAADGHLRERPHPDRRPRRRRGPGRLETGLGYALDRKQFGQAIFEFPRVHNKLAMMAAEIMGVRQLTYFAARQKDEGKRCDLEAGMAKLIAARVAWAAADNALQIHGGNGFAMEYVASRLLADARILNIFEGAGEIQAQVIARRLLEEGN
jgi:(2S)-methylsuccinyl-CoA dehydrogenase